LVPNPKAPETEALTLPLSRKAGEGEKRQLHFVLLGFKNFLAHSDGRGRGEGIDSHLWFALLYAS